VELVTCTVKRATWSSDDETPRSAHDVISFNSNFNEMMFYRKSCKSNGFGQALARQITTKVEITRMEGALPDSPSFRESAVGRLVQ
jgi:hypothetical protein